MSHAPTVFDWSWFRDEMHACSQIGQSDAASLLGLLTECDRLVGVAINRPMSYASERPQDFVVSNLVVRSFRLTISSIHLALHGYADSTPNLGRTVWEIGIRLIDIQSDPVAGALGYLLHGSQRRIATMEAELAYRLQEGIAAGNLSVNLQSERGFLDQLQEVARQRGLVPEVVERSHGKLNVRQICRAAGIEKAYLVDYAYDSGHVHETDAATDFFGKEAAGQRVFEVGPIFEAIPHAVADALIGLGRVLALAADILDDSALGSGADLLLATLNDRLDHLGMSDGPR